MGSGGARPQRRWSVTGPGPPHTSTPDAASVEGAGVSGGPGCGAHGRRRGRGGFETTCNHAQHRRRRRCEGHQREQRARLRCPWAVAGPGRASNTISTPGAASVEGAGGNGGPGCGARGRWRGLAGLRGDAPSEARGADDSRAGRRPRRSPAQQHTTRRPEHQRHHKQQHTAQTARGRPGPPAPGTPAAQHAT